MKTSFSLPLTAILGALCLTKLALAQGDMSSTDNTVTSADNIISALLATNQTEGIPDDAWPAEPVDATVVATNTSDVLSRRALVNKGNVALLQRRTPTSVGSAVSPKGTTYQVFSNGQDPSNQYSTAAVQMPNYLTYTVVSNATDASGNWNFAAARDQCLNFCDKTANCVTANLYKEYNNALLDWTFSEKSNAKCALFGDVPELDQITNKGGQQLEPKPHPLTRIDSASVFSVPSRMDPNPNVAGYTQVYGPISASNNAPGYMTYKFLSANDPVACSKICTSTQGCVAFNTWRGVVKGDPTTYTCSLYSQGIDQSTAVNTGDQVNKVVVTYSRGYVNSAYLAKQQQIQQCVANNAMQGFNYAYYPRTDLPTDACNFQSDISGLSGSPSYTSAAVGQDLNAASSGDTFQPYGSSQTLSSNDFSMMHTFFFQAPADDTYTFNLPNSDDIGRTWYGDAAKSGWTTATPAQTSRWCQPDGAAYTATMKKGDLLPIRLLWTEAGVPGHVKFGVSNSQGNDLGHNNFVTGSCDGTVTSSAFASS